MPKRKKREMLLYFSAVAVSALFSAVGGLLSAPSVVAFWVFLYKALWVFFSCRGGQIDWDSVDWYSASVLSNELSDIMHQLRQIQELEDRLKICKPDHVAEVVSTEWKHFGDDEKKRLSFMLDGEEDIEDWKEYCQDKKIRLLERLDDITCDIVQWREENIGIEKAVKEPEPIKVVTEKQPKPKPKKVKKERKEEEKQSTSFHIRPDWAIAKVACMGHVVYCRDEGEIKNQVSKFKEEMAGYDFFEDSFITVTRF